MCGIVGSISFCDITPRLAEGLQRLEYRGYDSAGIAVLDENASLQRVRAKGKMNALVDALIETPLVGNIGIGHTRWATHGEPVERNAHPHLSGNNFALVHNGIIENYQALRETLKQDGFDFTSDTDSETIAHLFAQQYDNDLINTAFKVKQQLQGAYAVALITPHHPQHLLAMRFGSPLVIGLGDNENFVASDPLALLPLTQRFIYLEEGDVADIEQDKITIYDKNQERVTREVHELDMQHHDADRGQYRHYMLKEINEQTQAVRATMQAAFQTHNSLPDLFGTKANDIFKQTQRVQIVACGTSYHAGMIARYWLESIAGIACQTEIASEIRYRKTVVEPNNLFVTISQSGETADTLAALQQAKQLDYLSSLSICNVPQSSLVRESDLSFLTRAGREVGVASTKAFTTQLTALLLMTLALAEQRGLSPSIIKQHLNDLKQLPHYIEEALALDSQIVELAELFADKQHCLFLGRGMQYPVAMEGALKLKEISYIHAEAYPAGELKHGPLALVDENMPVVAVAPNDELFGKLLSNLREVQARGGQLIVFADKNTHIHNEPGIRYFAMPSVPEILAPIVYTIPLQLLAYHVAIIKGTDVDQPRNLAKSVTVE
jgi:glutamine---fructose-6-phosphate transaminase (isomerizing)